jgi:phage terminase small subunit
MPRKSAEAARIVVDTSAQRVAPRPGTPEPVAQVFRDLVESVSADHFTVADLPLLESYSEAICMSRMAWSEIERDGPVIDGKTSPWVVVQEKAHRAQVALAARLRLCPQSRFDRGKAGTTSREQRGPRIDWSDA